MQISVEGIENLLYLRIHALKKKLIEKRPNLKGHLSTPFYLGIWLNNFLFEIVQVITTLYGAIGNLINKLVTK
jgi:hypothetical protein